MLEKTSQKLMVTLGVLVVLAGFGYFAFSGSQPSTTTEEIVNQSAVGQDIITLAEKMNTITIDDSIFTGAVFLSLVDHDIPIAAESQGRPNPFATIGTDGGLVVNPNINITGTLKPPITPPR